MKSVIVESTAYTAAEVEIVEGRFRVVHANDHHSHGFVAGDADSFRLFDALYLVRRQIRVGGVDVAAQQGKHAR
jgi:hypothetical protein